MTLSVTLAVLAAAVAVFLWATVNDRRPVDFSRPRMIPYLPIMMVAMVVILMMLAHLVTLLTGRPFAGRRGW